MGSGGGGGGSSSSLVQFQYSHELNFQSHSPSVCVIGDGSGLLPPSDGQKILLLFMSFLIMF